MLYEVITLLYGSLQFVAATAEHRLSGCFCIKAVITSYSIHYTKLYDFGGETHGKGVPLHLTGGRQVDVAAGINDFFGQPQRKQTTTANGRQ